MKMVGMASSGAERFGCSARAVMPMSGGTKAKMNSATEFQATPLRTAP